MQTQKINQHLLSGNYCIEEIKRKSIKQTGILKLDTLEGYLNQAKSIVAYFNQPRKDRYGKRSKHFFSCIKAQEIINNEDALSYVAYCIMCADMEYDPARKASPRTHRVNRAYYAILNVLGFPKRKLNKKLISINHCVQSHWESAEEDRFSSQSLQTPVSAFTNPKGIDLNIDIVDNKEEVHALLNNSGLTDKEKDIIYAYFWQQETYYNIAIKYNVTKTTIQNSVKKSLGKMQEYMGRNDAKKNQK